jgi:hypothetical protein
MTAQVLTQTDLIWPASGTITQNAAQHRASESASAEDIANSSAPPVFASYDGTVSFAGTTGDQYYCPLLGRNTGGDGFGNFVVIRHDGGTTTYYTLYAHLNSWSVTAGQVVTQGSQVGVMGNTGCSTGTHTHFAIGICLNGVYVASPCTLWNGPDPLDGTVVTEGTPTGGNYPGLASRLQVKSLGHFDSPLTTNIAVWRPSNTAWYWLNSVTGAQTSQLFGTAGDIPVPGDYFGSGNPDYAVYRPSNSGWYVLNPSTGVQTSQVFGTAGDIPVPGDYFGDGKTDYAVYRPSNNGWYVLNPSTGAQLSQVFGAPGDTPVPGDYFGDGKTDYGVYRPSNNGWYILNPSTGAQLSQVFGAAGDILVPGDYFGDGKTDYGVYRPSNNGWYVLNPSTGAQLSQVFGAAGDTPVPGDYFGDGKTDYAVWRPSNGGWYVLNPSTGAQKSQAFGVQGDMPV